MVFNKKITLQNKTMVADDVGNDIETWVDFKTLWCYANGISNREFYANASEHAENVVNFTARYFKALDVVDTINYRIVFQGKKYNIAGIDNFEFGNMTLKFRAIEGMNNG